MDFTVDPALSVEKALKKVFPKRHCVELATTWVVEDHKGLQFVGRLPIVNGEAQVYAVYRASKRVW